MSQGVAGITYVPDYEETEVTKKGTLWNENGECFRAPTSDVQRFFSRVAGGFQEAETALVGVGHVCVRVLVQVGDAEKHRRHFILGLRNTLARVVIFTRALSKAHARHLYVCT